MSELELMSEAATRAMLFGYILGALLVGTVMTVMRRPQSWVNLAVLLALTSVVAFSMIVLPDWIAAGVHRGR